MAVGRASRTPPAKLPNRAVGRHLWEITAVQDLFILLMAAALLWLIYWMRGIFLPVFIAAVLAHLFNPLVGFLESNWRWPRLVTASLILASVALLMAGFLLWLGPILYDQITALARNLPGYLRALSERYNVELGSFLQQFGSSLGQLQSAPEQILTQVFKTTGLALGLVTVAFSTATYVILALVLIGIYFFVFAWHFNTALEKLAGYLPQSRKGRLLEIFTLMDRAIADFFRGRLLIAFIIGLLLSIGWWLTGVPYWFFLGMSTGFLNIVPYLSFISWPIALLLKYIDAVTGGAGNPDFLSIALWPSVVYIGVQLLDNWILTPWIQSRGRTNMNPATILLVVLIGGSAGGIWGLLFAIPVAACIKIVLDEVVLPRLREWAAAH